MPKEYISTDPQERGSIKVTWGLDSSDVQLSIAGPVGWRDGHVFTSPDLDPDNGLDWHYSPNRSEINRLIRALRRARDQAYGQDA